MIITSCHTSYMKTKKAKITQLLSNFSLQLSDQHLCELFFNS